MPCSVALRSVLAALVWGLASCSSAVDGLSLPADAGDPPDVGDPLDAAALLDAAPGPFVRCLPYVWTLDGTIGGRSVEVTREAAGRGYASDGVSSVISLTTDDSVALTFGGRIGDTPFVTRGPSVVRSAALDEGAWFCGDGVATVTDDQAQLELAQVRALGTCATMPPVEGRLEACSRCARPLISTVDGVVPPAQPRSVGASGGGSAVTVSVDELALMAFSDGTGLVYRRSASGPSLIMCAERAIGASQIPGEPNTLRVTLEGLHRLPDCATRPVTGSLFVCSS